MTESYQQRQREIEEKNRELYRVVGLNLKDKKAMMKVSSNVHLVPFFKTSFLALIARFWSTQVGSFH